MTSPPVPPPPPPSSTAPRIPPARSTPSTPATPFTNGNHEPSLAMQAAINAFGSGRNSPAPPSTPAPAPPPLPPTPPPSIPAAATPSPPLISRSSVPPSTAPPTSRPPPQQPARSMLDASSYTLTNGPSNHNNISPGRSPLSKGGPTRIDDLRFKFQDDSQLPKPREFLGGPKRYRAGRGSSVPLDLSQFT